MFGKKKVVAVTEETLRDISKTVSKKTKVSDLADIGLNEGKEDSRPIIDRQQPKHPESNGEKKG